MDAIERLSLKNISNNVTLFGSTLLISEHGIGGLFECFAPRFSVESPADLKGSEIRRWLVFYYSSIRREPRSQQRSMALAGVDVNVSISVFTVAVADVFVVESFMQMARMLDIRRYRR